MVFIQAWLWTGFGIEDLRRVLSGGQAKRSCFVCFRESGALYVYLSCFTRWDSLFNYFFE